MGRLGSAHVALPWRIDTASHSFGLNTEREQYSHVRYAIDVIFHIYKCVYESVQNFISSARQAKHHVLHGRFIYGSCMLQ